MSAKLLKFTPKDRQGDPDFPGIPSLAHFYKPMGRCRRCDVWTAPGAKVCLQCAVAIDDAADIDWDKMAEERLGQCPPGTPK